MAIDVHVLGTASARPTPDRAVSGSLVKGPDGIAVILSLIHISEPTRHA